MNKLKHEVDGPAPGLRFPEFRDAGPWALKRLGKVTELKAGKFISAKEISAEHEKGFNPCYGGNGVRGYVESFTHFGEYPLIGRQGAYSGNIQLAKGKFHATEHAVVATARKNTNSDFLYFLLIRAELSRFVTGQAQPGLSVTMLNGLIVPIPANNYEQQKIADCLSSLDDLIRAYDDKLAALRRHKQGLMQQLFPVPGERTPRLRFPEFRSAAPWNVKPFGEIYNYKPTNSWSRNQLNYDQGSVKNIHYGDIHKGLNWSLNVCNSLLPYANPGLEKSLKTSAFCSEGDIVFADASEDIQDVGKAIEIISTDEQNVVAGLHTILASQIEKRLIIGFGAFLFASTNVRKQIQGKAQGAKIVGISKSQLIDVVLSYPRDAEEQKKIVQCLGSLDDIIEAYRNRLATLRRHKAGLMQQLFPKAVA